MPQPARPVDRWFRWGGALLAGISLVIIVAGLFLSRPAPPPPRDPAVAPPAPLVGFRAPDFTLSDLTGTSVRLASLAGHPLLLTFWYAACEGCRTETPALERIYQAHEQAGLIVLGINVADALPDARHFVQTFGITYPVLLDSNQSVLTAYRITGMPAAFFVDAHGVIRATTTGVLDDGSVGPDLATIGVR